MEGAPDHVGGPLGLVGGNRGAAGRAADQSGDAQLAAGWLTGSRLPAYAPELNPAEGVWANLKGKLINLAPRSLDQLVTLVKSHLKRMQYRPALLDGFIAQTGLTLEPL